MPFDWGGFGQNVAEAGIGAIFGIGVGKHNDKRQVAQQEKLQALQIKGQKEMTDYNTAKQYEMWLKTNYPAQVEQLKAAGLNPGLLYGMSGGGGTTTGSASGSVTGAQAPSGGGEIQAMAGMGLQLGMMQAQQKLIEAQADNLKADTENKRGVTRENIAMGTEKLFQEWQNLKQTHTLQELEATMKNIENFEKQASQGNRLRYIQYQTETALHNLKIVANENKISDATVQDQIKTIKQEAIYSVLKNHFIKSQTDKTKSDITVNDAQMRKWSLELMQGWDKMEQGNLQLHLQRLGIKDDGELDKAIDRILKITF